MDPSILLGILGMVSNVAGGVAGQQASAADRARAQQLLEQMMQRYGGLTPPSADQLQIPQLPNEDPTLRNSESDTLAGLKNISDQGGLQIQDIGALNTLMGRVGREATSRNAGALSQAAALGEGGAGSTLAAELQNNSAANQNANEAGTSIAGMAQQRALQAMMDRGQLAGGMRSQDLSQANARAMINQYNAQTNQTAYSDQLAKLAGMSGATDTLGGYFMGDAQRQAALYGGLGQAASQGLAGMSAAQAAKSDGNSSSTPYTPDGSTDSLVFPTYKDSGPSLPASSPSEWNPPPSMTAEEWARMNNTAPGSNVAW